MKHVLRARGGLALALALLGLLAFAPAALAGSISYAVPDRPEFAVKDEGGGIVKVDYRRCVTTNTRQVLAFRLTVNPDQDGSASFRILHEEGANPAAEFDPNPVFLQKGQSRTFDVTLAFTLAEVNNNITTFRIKLDPAEGQGLGEGPGIQVNIPCVLRPPPPEDFSEPVAGAVPPVGSAQARGPAPCISIPQRTKVRKGRRARIRVVVRSLAGLRVEGSLVTLRGAGLDRSKLTNERGVATFRFTPRRTGRIVIQSDVCFGSRRYGVKAVKGKRRVGRVRFTG